MTTPTTIGGGAEPAVLQDPTGRRARWLRRGGRIVFVAFLTWLVAIVLGGLGLAPVPGIPFAQALRPTGPAPLLRQATPTQPSAADLRPALPDTAVARTTLPAGRSRPAPPARGQSALAPGQTRTTTTGTTRGRSATAPGQTKTAPPGQTTTTPPGQSGTAPGQTKTPPGQTRTTPRKSKTPPPRKP